MLNVPNSTGLLENPTISITTPLDMIALSPKNGPMNQFVMTSTVNVIPPLQAPIPHVSLKNRRHSATVRRPLRSSPLAGPALSSEGHVIEEDGESTAKAKPSRISSSPDLPSYLQGIHSAQGLQTPPVPPVPLVLDPSRLSPVSASSPPSMKSKRTNARRQSSVPPSSERPSSPTDPRSTCSEPSTSLGRRSTSNDNSRSPDARSFHTLPASPKSPPENWLTANPYDTTPRFSRLSLSSSSVVLPVSARSSNGRRLSRAISSASLASSSAASDSRSAIGNTIPKSPGIPRKSSSVFSVTSATTAEHIGLDNPPSPAFLMSDSDSCLSSRDDDTSSIVSGSDAGFEERETSVRFNMPYFGRTASAPASRASSIRSEFAVIKEDVEAEAFPPARLEGEGRTLQDASSGTGRSRKSSLANIGRAMRSMSTLSLRKSKTDLRSNTRPEDLQEADKHWDQLARTDVTSGPRPSEALSKKQDLSDEKRNIKSRTGAVRRLWRRISSAGRKADSS